MRTQQKPVMLVKSFFILSVSLRNPLSGRTKFCRRFNSIRSEDVLVFFIAESISGSNRNVILSPKWMKAPFRGLGLFYTDSLHQLCFQLKKDFYIQFAILSSAVTWRDGSRQFVSFICWRPVLCLFYSDREGADYGWGGWGRGRSYQHSWTGPTRPWSGAVEGPLTALDTASLTITIGKLWKNGLNIMRRVKCVCKT